MHAWRARRCSERAHLSEVEVQLRDEVHHVVDLFLLRLRLRACDLSSLHRAHTRAPQRTHLHRAFVERRPLLEDELDLLQHLRRAALRTRSPCTAAAAPTMLTGSLRRPRAGTVPSMEGRVRCSCSAQIACARAGRSLRPLVQRYAIASNAHLNHRLQQRPLRASTKT